MAFRAPAQAPRRRTSYSSPQPPPRLEIPSASTEEREDDTTQWVLFSPTAHTHTTSTDRTQTAGGSRLSDFGSFGTATRSAAGPDGEADIAHSLADSLDEDGTELDSLDDGLHAFRAPSLPSTSPARVDQGPQAMLPTHDGLGGFQVSSQLAQDLLWQHEQYNPQRQPHVPLQPRRRSSVQRHLDTVDEAETNVEYDRWQRIEKWRMDQSRALIQEIERETRRRTSHASRTSMSRSVDYISPVRPIEPSSETATPREADETEESFWLRITRKVLRDLIGIDDSLLSAILGESLPQDEGTQSQTPTEFNMETILARQAEHDHSDPPLWQTRVIQRIARELGVLVHQLCDHPGAFNTYYQMTKDISNEYAGMSLSRLTGSTISHKAPDTSAPAPSETNAGDSMPSPQFAPTLQDANRDYEAQWGIEDEDPASEPARLQQEQEYWERGLDVMMVFRYLRTRFSRRGYMTADKYSPAPSPRHTTDASRRAAIIRQHHPLVARAHSRRASQYSGVSGPVGVSSPLVRPHRRPSSSCASQSAKLSALSSRRTLTGSSRNYWDIGGSESSSAIGVGAGLGTWGEA